MKKLITLVLVVATVILAGSLRISADAIVPVEVAYGTDPLQKLDVYRSETQEESEQG